MAEPVSWLRGITFLCCAVGIVWVSRASLRRVDTHGFYRLFAFETVLALIFLNLPHWFVDPFSARQLFSWAALIASIFLAAAGYLTLKRAGKPSGSFENTSLLVTGGVYRFIRHPMYASLLFLAWGACLKAPSLAGLVLALVASTFLWVTARVEEIENLKRFGLDYSAYMRTTRLFIPFLF